MRLDNRETLNQDQMVIFFFSFLSLCELLLTLNEWYFLVINLSLLLLQDAVGRYEEVIHNLKFAKELHKTLHALTQDVRTAL